MMTAPISRMIGANVLQCSDVRFGSKPDIARWNIDVRFTSKIRLSAAAVEGLKRATRRG
jgi:hypothetical protein